MKRKVVQWISLVLCFALLNLSHVGSKAAGNKPATDPISGLSSDSGTLPPFRHSAATADPSPWIKYSGNPVLDVGASGTWDSESVGLPSVLVRDGTYYLWYGGGSTANYILRIGLATSPDGVNWTKNILPVLPVGAAGTWDSGYVYAPDVIYQDGMYKMWYRGKSNPETLAGASIGYATSTDGVNWAKYSGNPVLTVGAGSSWDHLTLFSAYVLPVGATYKMWYSGSDGVHFRIGYATSPDGVNWTKYAGNPVLDTGPIGGWDYQNVYYPNILFNGSTYEMWYTASSASIYSIGHATSTDGVSWSKATDNPMLTSGPLGSWDSSYVLGSPVIAQFGIDKMWYSGKDAAGILRIGYATADLFTENIYLPVILR